jgi:SAM-dependent methyltransferase
MPGPRCRFCPNEALRLSDEVWFCWRCGRGESVRPYRPELYDASYSENYAQRGDGELGRRINLARAGLVATFLPLGASLLDFGCGAGDFLRVARQMWRPIGVEANAKAAALAQNRSACRVEPSLAACAGERLNAVCFFDSLEHVERPEELLSSCLKMLEPKGLVFVTMPELPSCFCETSSEEYLARVFSSWRHAKPEEHLSYWTFEGFRRFAEGLGLRIVHYEHNESFLRVDPLNSRNIVTFVMETK